MITMKLKLKNFSASGNTFYLVDARKGDISCDWPRLAQTVCQASGKVTTDGLLVLEASKKADVKMRIFNADGSEAEMCGNGARSVAYYLSAPREKNIKIETLAGIIEAKVARPQVKINLTDPKDMQLNIPLEVSNRKIRVSFINTGVPHAVVFVNSLSRIDVNVIGKMIRSHERFQPAGANVNFVEITGHDCLSVRTYERGVEAETLACGTGIVASVLISFRLSFVSDQKIKVKPTSGETLAVEFDYEDNQFSNVWLEGAVKELSEKNITI